MYLSHAFIVCACIISKSASTKMPSTPRLLHAKSAVRDAADNTIIHHYSDLRVGKLVTRYKRFLADIVFDDNNKSDVGLSSSTDIPTANGSETSHATVVHCPNTGSMYNLIPPSNSNPACACSVAPDDAKRKYRHTLEMIMENNTWVGVHSALANKMVENALNAK